LHIILERLLETERRGSEQATLRLARARRPLAFGIAQHGDNLCLARNVTTRLDDYVLTDQAVQGRQAMKRYARE
jgi:hypothetical protein